jgi:hypothetical protein
MGPCVTFEVPDAIVRNEKCPDRPIAVVGYEPAAPLIELGSAAIRPSRRDHIFARPGIAKLLRIAQVLLLCDRAELVAVFGEMLVEQMPGAKSRPSRQGKDAERADQDERFIGGQ